MTAYEVSIGAIDLDWDEPATPELIREAAEAGLESLFSLYQRYLDGADPIEVIVRVDGETHRVMLGEENDDKGELYETRDGERVRIRFTHG